VAVPGEILEKRAALDPEEWAVMRSHTVVGEEILAAVPEMLRVSKIVRHSHERFEGGGYPDGLAGADIPLASRIVFCADAFHAVRSDRPYRRGRTAAEALEEIRANAGTQFDPQVVAALDEVARELREAPPRQDRSPRARRLAVLLLTLAVSGTAFAATGGFEHLPFASSAPPSVEAAACGSPCQPAELGRLGTLPEPAARVPRGAVAEVRSAERRGRSAQAQVRAGEGPSAAGRRRGTPDPSEGSARVAKPFPPASNAPKAVSAPQALGPPAAETVGETAPGRSGVAPRWLLIPGKPVGGAPGRSELAPAKPFGPGRFGLP
jgi:hypothetical protein